MPPVPQSGFLAVADVSGYTAFLTGSELDHAHDIMRGVMRVVAKALGHPLRIVKYEGDAILCYAAGDAPLLLDVLEGAYVAFRDHVFNMTTCTTCACKACGNLKTLDLKFFVHHGRYIVESGGTGEDLAGPDVILLHRLMKNHVKEETGVGAYILATSAALEQAGAPAGFVPHSEEYEHFGAVACGVADLHRMLEQRRDARSVRVTREDAQVVSESIVSGSPSAVWDYYFDPPKRLRWDDSLTGMRRNARGREQIGSTMHCAHGSFTSVGTTLDWKPFTYFTQEYVPQALLVPPVIVTIETEALPDGRTRIVQLARAARDNPLHRVAVALRRGAQERIGARGFARLERVILEDARAPTRTADPSLRSG